MGVRLDKHNYSISFLRMVSMVFIVLCHFCRYYGSEFEWWFNVGVQVFFCISGFLYGSKKIDDPIGFITKNFKKILVPYFVFLIPTIVAYFIFARGSIGIMDTVGALLCCDTIDGIGHLWFVGYILLCYLATPYLYWLFKKMEERGFGYVLSVFIALLVVAQGISLVLDSYFEFGRMAPYFVGYFLAFIIRKYSEKTFKILSALIFIGAICTVGIRIYMRYFVGFKASWFGYFEQYSHVLLGVTIFLLGYILLKNMKGNKIMSLSDKYSYYVYIVHQLLILSPFSLMAITSNVYLNWGITLVAIVVMSVVLKFLSDKVTNIISK